MTLEEELQALLDFDGDGSPVLSLYLTVDPAHSTKAESHLRARRLLEMNGQAEASADINRVDEFFQHEYEWQDKGLAIFSCNARSFWRVVRLPIPILESATVMDKPYLRPLKEALSSQARIGVALVDRGVARFFGIYLGEVRELGEVHRQAPKRHKQTEPSPKWQRSADEAAQQNLKQAAKRAAAAFKEFKTSELVLAGQSEQIRAFREQLPKAWQSSIIGEVALDMDATPARVLAKVKQLVGRTEAAREEALVETLDGAARKKGPTGTLGLADTLAALMDGKVMTLVTADGFRAKGYQCENCGFLSAGQVNPCPVCGHNMKLVEHAVDLAIRKALDNDARVEPVRAERAVRRMKALGGIGALLRY